MTEHNNSRSISQENSRSPQTGPRLQLLRGTGAVSLAIAVIAASARIAVSVPLSPVPVTGQTLAVLLVGGLLGSRLGPLAVGLYLLAGVAGLPVFADGAVGLERLAGPTGGYLIGFVAGAWLVGWAAGHHQRGLSGLRQFGRLLAATTVAHATILLIGGGRLAMFLGLQGAWTHGIAPFLLGAVLKSFLAATLVAATVRWLRPTRLSDSFPATTTNPEYRQSRTHR